MKKLHSLREIPKVYPWRLKDLLRWMFSTNPNWPLYPDWRFYGEIRVCMAAGEVVEIFSLSRRNALRANASRNGPSAEVGHLAKNPS